MKRYESSLYVAGLAAAAVLVLAGCGATSDKQDAAGTSTSAGATGPTSTATSSQPSNVPLTTTAVPGTTTPGSVTATTTVVVTTGGPAEVTVLVRGAGFCTHLPTEPSPECDPKPLPGVAVSLSDSGGDIAARATTGDDGTVRVSVAPGTYTASSDPVPGFDLTAQPATVTAQVGEPAGVILTHNTGFQ